MKSALYAPIDLRSAVILSLTILAMAVTGASIATVTARHATEPVALAPNCDTLRVHHPDPRRLVRIIDCVTGDTTVERSAP